MTTLPPFTLAAFPITEKNGTDAYLARMRERGEISTVVYTPPPMGDSDGERCDWCGQECDDPCSDECDCPTCEVDRALADDEDMRSER